MDIVKINGTTLEIRDSYGGLKRIIAQNVKYAEINPFDGTVLVTRTNGDVDLLDNYGGFMRKIGNNANMAKFQGNDILVYKTDGKIELKDTYGGLKRYI